ncbi:hypothetical protein CW304_18790 [Bacillus sp. UFRGS-B20]|nr:hypothetical protein CW304_18790 [Bacillus sp. UFRGS-B20]
MYLHISSRIFLSTLFSIHGQYGSIIASAYVHLGTLVQAEITAENNVSLFTLSVNFFAVRDPRMKE